MSAVIDFHSHLLPGVDDGAENLDQTRAGLQLMWDQGVRTIVTTPHLSGTLTERPEALEEYFLAVDAAWVQVKEVVATEFPGLRFERGNEVMLDTPTPDLSDPRVRLAGTSFVLVEFPYMNVPPNCATALFDLKMAGWRPIIAHPERYRNLVDFEVADEWRSVGGLLQVNCGSLLGRYGQRAEKLAWGFLERGWVDYLSSDFHGKGTLYVADARALLESRGGKEIAKVLFEDNPARMLEGEEPLHVPPLEPPRSLWRRILGPSS